MLMHEKNIFESYTEVPRTGKIVSLAIKMKIKKHGQLISVDDEKFNAKDKETNVKDKQKFTFGSRI